MSDNGRFILVYTYHISDKTDIKYINMWFNRPITGRNYSGEQQVKFESPVPFSKCLRTKIYSTMNEYFDPQGCQTLLLKESEPLLLPLGSWTSFSSGCFENFCKSVFTSDFMAIKTCFKVPIFYFTFHKIEFS